MSITDDVEKLLSDVEENNKNINSAALEEAERMANEFSEIKPVPYVVPIERYVGLPVFEKTTLN